MKGFRWMSYHLTVHAIIISMSKKTIKLTTMCLVYTGKQREDRVIIIIIIIIMYIYHALINGLRAHMKTTHELVLRTLVLVLQMSLVYLALYGSF